MAQYTGGITFRNLDISISTDGVPTYTDVGGGANSVSIGGGDRNIGSFHTADGDTPILGAGKREALEVTIRVLYTESAGEAAELLRAAYEAGTETVQVKYAPKGESSGNFLFTCAEGIVRNHTYPQGEVAPGEPVPIEVTIMVPSITKSVIA